MTSEQGIHNRKKTLESPQPVRKCKRLPFAKQTEKLGGVPCYTRNNKKKLTNNVFLLQEKTTTMEESEERETIVKYGKMTEKSV